MKPATAVAVAQFDEVHGAVIFVAPVVVFNVAYADIYQNHTARPQHGNHAPVRQSDVSISVAGVAVRKDTLEASPLFHHPGKQLSSLGIECRIEPQGSL